jgi:predicted dehydrogenase
MAFRIGLMGCGTVANYGHLPALASQSQLQLHSLFDPDPARLRATQQRFGVPHATSDLDAFFGSGIDAVSITSPAPCHLANLRDAARHGKHVLCEKPLASTETEGQEMIDTAQRAGILLFTGFTARFNPVSGQIRKLLAEKVVGRVRALRLVYIWGCHGKYETGADGQRREQGRRAGRMAEGGPLVDCGVHDIDLARWWLDSEVVRFRGAGAWVDDYDAPDHVWLHMDHACGAHTMVEISYSYCHTALEPEYHLSYELIGSEGVISYAMETGQLQVRSTTGTQVMEFGEGKNFDGMYSAFADALAGESAVDLATGVDGLAATRIARAATDQVMAERYQY